MNRIAELRKEQSLTQQDLAKLTGLALPSISSYERGIRKPKIETWNKIAKALKTSTGYVQGISNIRTPFNSNNMEEWWNNTLGYMEHVGTEQYDQEHQQHEIKKNTVLLKPILDILSENELADINYDKEIMNDEKRSEFYSTIEYLAILYRLPSSRAQKELTTLNENLEQKVMMADRPSELGGYDNDLSDKRG